MENESRGLYGRYLPLLLTLGDFVLLNLVFLITVWINPDLAAMDKLREVWLLLNIAFVPVPLWQYYGDRNLRAIVLDLTVSDAVKAVGIHALCFLAMMTIIDVRIPLLQYLEYYGMMLVAMPVWWAFNRRMVKFMRRRGRNYVSVVIVGTGNTGTRLAEAMQTDLGYGYKILGFFDDTRHKGFGGKYLGRIDDLREYVRHNYVQEIFYAVPGEDEEMLARVVKIADDNVIPFYYVPQVSRYVSRNYAVHNLGSLPVLSTLRNPLKNPLNKAIKRTFDIVFSSVALIFSPLVFIPIAIGVKMSSPGPVFFRQERTGLQGRSFHCLKFRTMRVNTDADSLQATSDDPRKTAFGDFLRRTSLDELPQFINVFLGDMSVVGPRPHMVKQTEDYARIIDKYMVRHTIKPGITGWAQISGYRGLTDELWKMEKRVEYDVWYIEHWNFFLDLKIIFRTVVNAFRGEENAY
ncbi:MAG: undecaprenyl-phosphate glucose phosphotransferase [Muribaculaceae bacterium]